MFKLNVSFHRGSQEWVHRVHHLLHPAHAGLPLALQESPHAIHCQGQQNPTHCVSGYTTFLCVNHLMRVMHLKGPLSRAVCLICCLRAPHYYIVRAPCFLKIYCYLFTFIVICTRIIQCVIAQGYLVCQSVQGSGSRAAVHYLFINVCVVCVCCLAGCTG